MPPAVVHTTPSNSQTPTIPSTTAGNALVVCVMGSDRGAPPAVTGVTLGGSATGWVPLEASNDSFGDTFAAIWANYSIAGGKTAVAISGTDLDTASGTGGVVIYEVSGVLTTAALDQVSTDNTSDLAPTAAYTSGPTPPATTQASEIWIGCANADGGSITGPASAWTNTAPGGGAAVAGYQVVSATGNPVYAGACASGGWSATVATLKGQVSTPGAAALHGGGTVTAAAALSGAAQLHGGGTVTAAATLRLPGAAALHGGGTVTAAATLRLPGAAALHGGGTVAANPAYTTSGAAQLHGGGTVHATATVTAPGGTAAAPPPLDGYRRLLRRRAHRILGMRL
jgi:hypothetical protein